MDEEEPTGDDSDDEGGERRRRKRMGLWTKGNEGTKATTKEGRGEN